MTRDVAGSGELVSALVDGELAVGDLPSAMDAVAGTPEGCARWQSYHLIGDALRGSAQVSALDGQAFVARLRGRLAAQEDLRPAVRMAEPADVSVVANTRVGVNDPVVRWKFAAGLASLAALLTLGWHVASLDAGAGIVAQNAPGARAQTLAKAPVVEAPPQVPAAAPVMLRDARLDELLVAHKQFGGTSALQMPAGFLRNATFDGADR